MTARKLISLRLAPFLVGAAIIFLSCSDKGTDPENRPPRITSPSSVEAVIDELFSYTATATDPDGTTPTIGFENVPVWMDTSGATISGTPTAETPDTSFIVTVSDDFLTLTGEVAVTIVTEAPQISYSQQIQPIFNANCGGQQCHIGGSSFGLRLNNYSTLMEGGNSGVVVIPGDPQNSIIIKRLEGRIIPQMPFGRSPLPQATIQLIRDWIAEGAHNN